MNFINELSAQTSKTIIDFLMKLNDASEEIKSISVRNPSFGFLKDCHLFICDNDIVLVGIDSYKKAAAWEEEHEKQIRKRNLPYRYLWSDSSKSSDTRVSVSWRLGLMAEQIRYVLNDMGLEHGPFNVYSVVITEDNIDEQRRQDELWKANNVFNFYEVENIDALRFTDRRKNLGSDWMVLNVIEIRIVFVENTFMHPYYDRIIIELYILRTFYDDIIDEKSLNNIRKYFMCTISSDFSGGYAEERIRSKHILKSDELIISLSDDVNETIEEIRSEFQDELIGDYDYVMDKAKEDRVLYINCIDGIEFLNTEELDTSEWYTENYETVDISEIKQLAKNMRANVEILPNIENPREELNKLIGCIDIKKQIETLCRFSIYNQKLATFTSEHKKHNLSLHSIFQGNPGTGKTTVCRIYGSLLHNVGILSKGHVVKCDRATFVGENFGMEEKAVKDVLQLAKGGVLMIDEAYQLKSNHPEDPSNMVLQMMMAELADENNRDFAVVLCGYEKPLQDLLETNIGLESRFPNVFNFPDFTVDELLDITINRISEYDYTFTDDAWEKYRDIVTTAYNNRDKNKWGNARFIANLLETIYMKHGVRCFNLQEKEDLQTITSEDIAPIPQRNTRKYQNHIGF